MGAAKKGNGGRKQKSRAQRVQGQQMAEEIEDTLKTLEGVAATNVIGKERRRNLYSRLKSKGLKIKGPNIPSLKLRSAIWKKRDEREREAKEAGQNLPGSNSGRREGRDFLVTSQKKNKSQPRRRRGNGDDVLLKVKDYGKS